MRFHKRYPLLQLWLDSAGSRDAINVPSLAVARYEPAVSNGVHGTALLDLIFANGSKIAVLPYIEIDTIMLLERGRAPLIWPNAAHSLGYDTLDALERTILPWLESRTLARQANEELIQRFSDAIGEQRLEAARGARFVGASTYSESMTAFAPYAYATRFCDRGTMVGIADPYGASGAALLASRGARVYADLADAAQNAFAASWFGCNIYGAVQAPCTVTIRTPGADLAPGAIDIALDRYEGDATAVQIASPVPADVLISFDTEDAPPIRSFGVTVCRQDALRSTVPLTDSPVSGGSAGTILMLLREGFERASDADTDEAHALAIRLRAEGFTVELAPTNAIALDRRADLVHVFGLEALERGTAALQRFRAENVPIVATPDVSRNPQEGVWGSDISRAVFARSLDEGLLEERLELLALRRLSSDAGVTAPSAQAGRFVDVAIVATPAEETALRERHGFRGRAVVSAPYMRCVDDPASSVGALTGNASFAFVHAPLEWRTNPVLLMRAAAALRMPVVFAGRTVEVDALRYARAQAPELFLHLPEPTAEQLAALYLSARVFVDVSWGSRGLYRVQRALASGCAVVVSRNSYAAVTWPAAVVEVDPGSPVAIEGALKVAASRGGESTRIAMPGEAFSAVILAYATAQQERVPA